MTNNLRKNGSVIRSNLTRKISAELVMQLIAISLALRPETGIVLIENIRTKRSVKNQR